MSKGLHVRSRDLSQYVSGGYVTNEKTGNVSTDLRKQREAYKGRQYTVSEGHAASRDGKYREGGPFYTYRATCQPGFRPADLREGNITKVDRYRGPIGLGIPTPDQSEKARKSFRSDDTSDLDVYGADAIAICAPGNPNATLSTSMAEGMREGIPSLPLVQSWSKRANLYKGIAAEFLNGVFGWLPLVSEVEAVRDSARFHRTMLEQYRRDAGRNVRREFAFPTEHTVSEVQTSGRAGFPLMSTGDWNSGPAGTLTTVTETTVDRWFSGAFTYALPDDDSFASVIRAGSEADYLFGIAITPDVLWELTPWSWAIDWFTNTSSVIHNAWRFGTGGLVMRYGYMMEEKTVKVTRSIDRCALKGIENQSCPSSSSVVKTKVRRPANPFGFGLTGSDLSPLQELIAAAVGITKIL